jgi:hypothetical protein
MSAFSSVCPAAGRNFLFTFFVPRIMLLYTILISIWQAIKAVFTGKNSMPSWYKIIYL